MPTHWLVSALVPTVFYPMALYRVALFGLALYARAHLKIAAEDVALLLRASKLVPGRCTCPGVGVSGTSGGQYQGAARLGLDDPGPPS
jgi:hypothetical protein